ncbi:MAG: sodium:solute symporter family protein, partial [Bacilli bacterium]
SLIGTAQLAFSFGMSAWWFTLGIGIGCLILTLFYVIPLRSSSHVTLLQVISDEYGESAEYLGSVLSSVGIFISIYCTGNCSECTSDLHHTTVTPTVSTFLDFFMSVYVIFGRQQTGCRMGGY